MFLAKDETGDRILPYPGGSAVCPLCEAPVIPKCGEKVTWHWAHQSVESCDAWGEHESDWHFGWKQLAGMENCEITIEKGGISHRADIQINDTVFEVQNSPLSPDEIYERENFYDNMVWIINGAVLSGGPYQWLSGEALLFFRFGKNTKLNKFDPNHSGLRWADGMHRPTYIHYTEWSTGIYVWKRERYQSSADDLFPGYVEREVPPEHGGRQTLLKDIMVEIVPGREHYCKVFPASQFVDYYFKGIPQEVITEPLKRVIEF